MEDSDYIKQILQGKVLNSNNTIQRYSTMEFRSRSCRDESCNTGGREFPGNMQDLRSYSASYSDQKEGKMKKVKKASKSWSFSDPEIQRKKRVASYRVYDMEGKMKGSLRKSFRWIKNSYNHVIYGWW